MLDCQATSLAVVCSLKKFQILQDDKLAARSAAGFRGRETAAAHARTDADDAG